MINKTVIHGILYFLLSLAILSLFIFRLDLYSQYIGREGQTSLTEDSLMSMQMNQHNHFLYNFSFREGDIYFCNEKIPLSELEVFEAFERDFLMNVNDRTQMTMFIKRAGRFFPFIEGELKKAGLPDDLKYLMVAESGMLDVVSQAGAAGFWQIMVETGRQYGLEVNKVVDERYHLLRSTQVAIQYLKDAYSRFKSWCLAAASYNMGMDGVSIILENQAKTNYFELWLNRETIRYVYRITAIKEIMQNKAKYGYGDVIPYKPLDLTFVAVSQKIPDLVAWASNQGYSYKDIRYLNTWIKKDYLPTPSNSIKQYIIFLPANGKRISTK